MPYVLHINGERVCVFSVAGHGVGAMVGANGLLTVYGPDECSVLTQVAALLDVHAAHRAAA